MSYLDSGNQLPPWLQQGQGDTSNPWIARMQNMLAALRGGGGSSAQVVNPTTGTAGTNISPQMQQASPQMGQYGAGMQQMQQQLNAPIVTPPGAVLGSDPTTNTPAAPTLGPTLGGSNTPSPSPTPGPVLGGSNTPSPGVGAGLFSPIPGMVGGMGGGGMFGA